MITLNDYLYSGDTVLKILQKYTEDLRKEAKKNHNEVDLVHSNFLLQITELLEHNDFLTAQSQKIREFYKYMAHEYPFLAFTFKGRIKSLIRAEEKFNGYVVEYIYDYYRENGGIIFPNPNAPTAIYEELDFIEDILEHNRDSIVIVDEAYIDFAGRSALELIDRYDNLIVTQTFSKARSMAGMRIGYAISNPELIRCLNDVKYSFNSYTMNQTAIACGVEAVRDKEYFEEHVRKIIETREWAKEELHRLGFEFPDAKANFIFATHPQTDAGRLFEALKANDIYVRHWDSERIGQYLRITVGTREEMQVLFDFLTKYIKGE